MTAIAFSKQGAIDHYNQMARVADIYGISLKNSPKFLGLTREDWQRKADADVNLNNVPLHHFDSLAHVMKRPVTAEERAELAKVGVNGWALYLGACVYKTLVYRDILGMDAEQYGEFKERGYALGHY